MTRSRLRAGILVGGVSRRMGRDKSCLVLDGRSFARRVADAVSSRVDQIVWLGDGPLPDDAPAHDIVPDAPAVRGPLAGILAALSADRDSAWLIAACDLPLISTDAIDWLIGERDADHWAVLPMIQPGTAEPLLAIYEPTISEEIERLATSPEPAPSQLANHSRVKTPTPPVALASAWQNVNTARDFERLTGD